MEEHNLIQSKTEIGILSKMNQRSTSHIPRLQRSSSLRAVKRSDSQDSNHHHHRHNHNNNNTNTKKEDQLRGSSSTRLQRSHSFTSTTLSRYKDQGESDNDASSVKSFGSVASFASCDLESIKNGSAVSTASAGRKSSTGATTQSNGCCKKYILHCQREVQPTDEKYLTPTQRKDKQIRQLKAALVRATRSCEERGVEVDRLASEVDRLRYTCDSGASQVPESPLTVLEEDPASQDDGNQTDKSVDSLLKGSESSRSKLPLINCLEDSGILSDLLMPCALQLNEQLLKPKSMIRNFDTDSNNESCGDDFKDLCSRETQTERGGAKNLPFYLSSERKLQEDAQVFANQFPPKVIGLNLSSSTPEQQQQLPQKQSQTNGAHLNNNNGVNGYNNNNNTSTESCYWPILEDVKRCHAVECQELREKHNNKVESLLQKLSELNSRYFEVRSAYEKSLERCRVLDTQVAELKKEMAAQEEWHSQMYLKMYRKGQEAAKFEHADEVLEFAHKAPKRVSVPELLQQLHRTEHQLDEVKELYRCELYCRKPNSGSHSQQQQETQQQQTLNGLSSLNTTNGNDRQAEYTLKFLKDAVYYYLTEKDNRGHLKAIESILGFSDTERIKVAKASRHKSRLI